MAPSVQRRKVWLMPTTRMPCSRPNAAKMRNSLKLGGVPQTTGSISDASGPKFTILWNLCGHVEDTLLLNKFFRLLISASCEDIARQNCLKVAKWRFWATFLGPAFPASRVQEVSDLHLKFALRPHHVWKYGRHPIGDGWDWASKKEERTITAWKYQKCGPMPKVMVAPVIYTEFWLQGGVLQLLGGA